MTTLHTVAATGALKLSWLLLVFPLFGAVVLLTGGRRTDRWGHLLGVAMPVAAFVYGVIAFFSLLGDRTCTCTPGSRWRVSR
jgi:NADH-quinone oxidoreductase subunit L